MNDPQTVQAPQATPLQGVLVLFCVVLVVTAFLWLSAVVGLAETWPAFLFLLLWGSVHGLKLERLLPMALGAALGLGMAMSMLVLPDALGPAAWVVLMPALLATIYCQIMQWLPSIVNLATMVFLSVGTIPTIQANSSFQGMFAALAFGVLFFGGLAWTGRWLKLRRARKTHAR